MPKGDFETVNKYYSEEKDHRKGHPLALRIHDEWQRAIIYDQPNRSRNRENWQLYWGVDNGQFPDEVISDMNSEGRILRTFNIATQKVDSLAGSILKNPLEMDYIPIDSEISALTLAVKQAQLSDKELMDWKTSKEQVIIGGLIYEGIEEMYISDKYHKLGNIAFREVLPGHFVWDPHWQTTSATDCIKGWKVSYLTPRQMTVLWPDKKEEIWRYFYIYQVWGDEYGEFQGIVPNFDILERTNHGDRLQVVEQYEMIDKDVEVEYDTMTDLDLPETDDVAVKIKFLNETNPYWTPENLAKRTKTQKICQLSVICPDLGLHFLLEDRPTEIQIGRLPFFTWSASRQHGQVRGIIDLIKDAQHTINYRENLITYMIETQAHGGELVDPQLFNDKMKLDDYIANKNNPSRVFQTAAGALSRGLAPVKIRAGEFPTQVNDQLQRMWDVIDRISKAPAVQDARSEGSGESGYLFAQKTAMAEQQQYILFSGLERYEGEKGEAYLMQAQRQYSLGGMSRKFVFENGKKSITVNERVTYENGQVGILNDISQLPRHKVIISQSPSGTTTKLTTRALAIEIMQTLPPESIGTRQILSNTLIKTVDQLSEKDKEKLDEMAKLETELVTETLLSNIMALKTQRVQAEMQLQQIQGSGQGAPASPPQGVLPPGAAAPQQAIGQEGMAPQAVPA